MARTVLSGDPGLGPRSSDSLALDGARELPPSKARGCPGEDPALSDQLCSALVCLSSPAGEVLRQREVGEPRFPQQSLQFMLEVGGSHPNIGDPTRARAVSPQLPYMCSPECLEALWSSSHLAPHLPSLLPSLSKPSCRSRP